MKIERGICVASQMYQDDIKHISAENMRTQLIQLLYLTWWVVICTARVDSKIVIVCLTQPFVGQYILHSVEVHKKYENHSENRRLLLQYFVFSATAV